MTSAACKASISVGFGSEELLGVPRSFFAPKPNGNACYTGYDICDTGAVLYQLSYQASWELATLGVTT